MVSRRTFLAAAAGAALFLPFGRALASDDHVPFQHGVASGDPLVDRVILWTRVTPEGAASQAGAPQSEERRISVSWLAAMDPEMQEPVRWGLAVADPDRDYTVKVDATGLEPGTTYYYRFFALGHASPIGRTRTLPVGDVDRLRLAVVSCSNWPYGFFNVYGNIGRRSDLDAVLHVGDYIYEYANGVYGDGSDIDRLPEPNKELIELSDYRTRHAQYKTDADLQEAHRQHPFIVIWDDHEFANDAWFGGAAVHDMDEGDGPWITRRSAAAEAYFEWLPIREPAGLRSGVSRQFAFGNLLDLIMLDARIAGRDRQAVDPMDDPTVRDPGRQLLGAAQERWFTEQLSESSARGTVWRLVGQQVMLGQLKIPPGEPIPIILEQAESVPLNMDQWDGYPASRRALLDHIEEQEIDNVVVLTGDIHSSWGMEISKNPYLPIEYDPETSRGSLAVEFVTPAVTSPALEDPDLAAISEEVLYVTQPHLRFVDLFHRGYILLDITRDRTQAEWHYTPTVKRSTGHENVGHVLQTTAGTNRLESVDDPSAPIEDAPPLAP